MQSREAQKSFRDYVAIETFRNLDRANPDRLASELNETYNLVEDHIKYTEETRRQIVGTVVGVLESCNFTCV